MQATSTRTPTSQSHNHAQNVQARYQSEAWVWKKCMPVGKTLRRKWHVCCAVLRYISYAKFSQILEVLRDFHRLFGSRNSPTTGILHTIRHVYRSVWPTREAKPRFGAALV